ncbi:hypothetical protein HYX14_05805 [Candidatus Woesearchaeota archaeon]|nr:hypothetical protein [Candidatus Woesearchaeota archaeon]
MRKGSLNLSIEAIVVVVIAFIVLGLGLGFVKGTFKDITGTSKEVQANIKEQILNDLRASNKKLSVPGQIVLERGEEVVQGIGVMNGGTSTLIYGIKITPVKKLSTTGATTVYTKPEDVGGEIIFFYSDEINLKLSPTDANVIKITISASNQASGNYLYKADVWQEITEGGCSSGSIVKGACEIYDTQSFFVKVS